MEIPSRKPGAAAIHEGAPKREKGAAAETKLCSGEKNWPAQEPWPSDPKRSAENLKVQQTQTARVAPWPRRQCTCHLEQHQCPPKEGTHDLLASFSEPTAMDVYIGMADNVVFTNASLPLRCIMEPFHPCRQLVCQSIGNRLKRRPRKPGDRERHSQVFDQKLDHRAGENVTNLCNLFVGTSDQ
jgi:hypothetical protein